MSMNKRFILKSAAFLAGVALLTSCSDKDVPSGNEADTETGTLAFTIDFRSLSGSRADGDGGDSSTDLPGNTSNGSEPTNAISNAVPVTSWDNIQSLQIFLYDRSGVIYFSDYIDATRIRQTLDSDPQSTGTITYTYANVPAGYYYLTAIANVNNTTQDISTKLGGVETTWDAQNVLNHYIFECQARHKIDAFPLFYQDQVRTSGIVRNETAYSQPSEIFTGIGSVPGQGDKVVTVEAGKTVNALVQLKREVSLMRLRINLAGEEGKANNAGIAFNPDGKVDFSRNAVIMLATLPECIIPMAQDMTDNNGNHYFAGFSSYTSQAAVLVTRAVDGTRHFNIANPTEGYSENGKIVGIEGDPFKANAWRDIIVFPNVSKTTATVAKRNRYLLIISALGLPGHITREGELTEQKTVYWVGYINEPFEPNKIREVNITFRDGGTQELPERPDNVGNLTVTVSEPQAWDSNIQASKIEL